MAWQDDAAFDLDVPNSSQKRRRAMKPIDVAMGRIAFHWVNLDSEGCSVIQDWRSFLVDRSACFQDGSVSLRQGYQLDLRVASNE